MKGVSPGRCSTRRCAQRQQHPSGKCKTCRREERREALDADQLARRSAWFARYGLAWQGKRIPSRLPHLIRALADFRGPIAAALWDINCAREQGANVEAAVRHIAHGWEDR